MGVVFKSRGDFNNTKRFMDNAKSLQIESILSNYGKIGCAALADATPVRTGVTADSWAFEVENKGGTWILVFTNTNINQSFSIALGQQFGHATGTGGWVQGQDYINPAMKPVFDQLADDAWREVTKV